MKIAIVALLVLVAAAKTGHALQCYACTTATGTGCADGAVASKYLTNCTNASCVKVVTTLLGQTTTVRSCSTGTNGCTGGGSLASVCTSVCQTDGCNGSNSVKMSVVVMAATVFTGLFIASF